MEVTTERFRSIVFAFWASVVARKMQKEHAGRKK